jgi:hypothetical protein
MPLVTWWLRIASAQGFWAITRPLGLNRSTGKKGGGYPVMKTCALLCLMTIGLSANAQDKPRIFVQGKGSERQWRRWTTLGSLGLEIHD